MSVEFQFDFPRSLAAITYIASRNIPHLTEYKLLKLLFLADKYHLVRYGRTITGDRYSALPDGPVPSRIYDIFKKQVLKTPFTDEGRRILENIKVIWPRFIGHPTFMAIRPYEAAELSKSDIGALESAITEFGKFNYGQFKKITHKMPAFDRAWKAKQPLKDAPLNFEDFFEDDKNALPGAKEEMIEDDQLRKALAESRTV